MSDYTRRTSVYTLRAWLQTGDDGNAALDYALKILDGWEIPVADAAPTGNVGFTVSWRTTDDNDAAEVAHTLMDRLGNVKTALLTTGLGAHKRLVHMIEDDAS